MNLITNYGSLTLQHWQCYAEQTCFAIDQNLKQAGEQLFFQLAHNPDINTIIQIMNQGSDTLVFVVFSYLGKYPNMVGKDLHSVIQIVENINSWQFRAFTFVRKSFPPFPAYIAKTIMSALGYFLKNLYQSDKTSLAIIDFLQQMRSDYFKLYLLKSFVDAIQVIDYQMGYVKYRTMVYSFQDNVMPMICQMLMPYFYNIEEGARINELSFLQQRLDVSDEVKQSNNNQVTITRQQELQTDYVFALLQKIVEFNYNITYSEYESQQPIDTCLITLPDKVSSKIINKEFLNALFFIVEKVSDVKIGSKKQQYLSISLSCIAKMMQSRLSYLTQSVKDSFVFHAIKGLTHLLKKCQQIGSSTILQAILLCNKKLYMSCQISYLRSVCIKLSEDGKSSSLFDRYLDDLMSVLVRIIQSSGIEVQNNLLLEALQLANKMLVCNPFRDDNMSNYHSNFQKMAQSIVRVYIDNLCRTRNIFGNNNKISSIQESKSLVGQCFQFFKKIASLNYRHLFDLIKQKINGLTDSYEPMLIFSNLLYLLSQLIDHNFLERNMYLERAKDIQYCILGQVIVQSTDLIMQYLQKRQQLPSNDISYIDSAVLIFTQSTVIQFLIGFENTTRFKIKQKLYLFMTYGQFYNEMSDLDDDRSENTIINYLSILTTYLMTNNKIQQNQFIVMYALDIIEKCIFKIKWHMKREIYLRTEIFKYLFGFFQSFFYDSDHIVSLRSRVAKILVSLTFDDVLDEYKFRINRFLKILKQQPYQLMHYDLIGIFEGIQTHVISKYFYNKLKRQVNLNNVFQTLYKLAIHRNDQKYFKDFCKLIRATLSNKGFKVSNAPITYQLHRLLYPFLINLLKIINMQGVVNMVLWQSSLMEIFQLFKITLTGNHINIYLLEKYTYDKSKSISIIKQFLIELMKTIILLTPTIKQYPQIERLVLDICLQINKELLNYILMDNGGQIIQVYSHLHIKNINIMIQYIQMTISGNKNLQERLEKSINCLRHFFLYFNKTSKYLHQEIVLSNLRTVYLFAEKYPGNNGNIQNKIEKTIEFIINILFTNNRNNYSLLKITTRLLYELTINLQGSVLKILSGMGLPSDKYLEAQSILTKQIAQSEEVFVEKMKNWIKQIDLF